MIFFPDSEAPSIRTTSHSQFLRAAVSGGGWFWHKLPCTVHHSVLSPVSSNTRDADDASCHAVFFLCAVQSLLLLSNPRSDIIRFSYRTYFHTGSLCPETKTDSVCLFSLTGIGQASSCSEFGLWHPVVHEVSSRDDQPMLWNMSKELLVMLWVSVLVGFGVWGVFFPTWVTFTECFILLSGPELVSHQALSSAFQNIWQAS